MLSVIASGGAPTAVRLRQASATACGRLPPGRPGSSAACSRWSAPGRALRPSMLTTAASAAPGRCTVWPPTVLSYWSQIQRREQRSGQATSVSSAAVDAERVGDARRRPAPAASASRRSGGDRAAPRIPAAPSGMSASSAPWWRMTMRPVSVRWPMTAKSSSHLRKIALGHVPRGRAEHHQHALLALRQHHLVGGHAGLALRHVVQHQLDADAALAGHLHARSWSARRRPCPGWRRWRRSPSAPGRPRSAASRRRGRRSARWGASPPQSAENSALAMVAPWMPSRPVLEPT